MNTHRHEHGERFARGEGRHGPRHARPRRRPPRRAACSTTANCAWSSSRCSPRQPRHGYEIIKAIEERLGGGYSPSPGVIYPTLTMLEELGHATVAEDAGKKQYTITDEGRAFLAANQPAVDAALARMEQRRDRQQRRRAARRSCARWRT